MSDAVPTLPAALRAWREPLAIFPRELALSLGPMLQRLAVLVGPFPALRQGEEGDPNGLDGITRRGRLERLLLSQWALAQEAPDEFVRRAAQQELQFASPSCLTAPRTTRRRAFRRMQQTCR